MSDHGLEVQLDVGDPEVVPASEYVEPEANDEASDGGADE
jgi:hypothetical protein